MLRFTSRLGSFVRRQVAFRPKWGNCFVMHGVRSVWCGRGSRKLHRGFWNGRHYETFVAIKDGEVVPAAADPGYDVIEVRYFESARTTLGIERHGKYFKVPRSRGRIVIATEFGGYDNGADVGIVIEVTEHGHQTSPAHVTEAVSAERYDGQPLAT